MIALAPPRHRLRCAHERVAHARACAVGVSGLAALRHFVSLSLSCFPLLWCLELNRPLVCVFVFWKVLNVQQAKSPMGVLKKKMRSAVCQGTTGVRETRNGEGALVLCRASGFRARGPRKRKRKETPLISRGSGPRSEWTCVSVTCRRKATPSHDRFLLQCASHLPPAFHFPQPPHASTRAQTCAVLAFLSVPDSPPLPVRHTRPSRKPRPRTLSPLRRSSPSRSSGLVLLHRFLVDSVSQLVHTCLLIALSPSVFALSLHLF